MAADTSTPDSLNARIAELKALRFGFDSLPLEKFRGLSDEQIEAHDGIGPKFRQRIRDSLAELEQLESGTLPEADTVATPAPAAATAISSIPPSDDVSAAAPATHDHPHTPESDLEPASPGGGGLPLLLLVIGLVALIVTVFLFTSNRGSGGKELEEARQQVATLTHSLGTIRVGGVEAALSQARRVYEAAHAGNFGDALDALENVERSLATIEKAAAQAGAEGTGAAGAGKGASPAAAKEALTKARTALKLEQPATRADVEAACNQLYQALAGLGPKIEEGHGNSTQAQH